MSAYCELVRELVGHSSSINSIRFTIDGNYCMTCSDDRTLSLWNPHKDDPMMQKRALHIKNYSGVHGYPVYDVYVSSDNGKFASAGGDKLCYLWDVATGRVIRRFQGHNHRINSLTMNDDCTVLISGSYDQSVICWDMRSNNREPIQQLTGFKDSVTCVKATSTEILASSVDGNIRIYDLRAGRMSMDTLSEPITYISLTHDKKCILSTCLGGLLKLTDISTGNILKQYHGHTHTSFKLESSVLSDDIHIVAGSEDGSIFFWDLLTANLSHRQAVAHPKAISSLCTHPNKSLFLTASFDGIAKCWHPNFK